MPDQRQIIQWAAGLAEGDAITREILVLHHLFTEKGYNSIICAPEEYTAPELKSASTAVDDIHDTADDLLIYHFGIASELDDRFKVTPARKILRFHNITPAHFYRPYDASVVHKLETAAASLETLCASADQIVPVSGFNAQSLDPAFAGKSTIIPLSWSNHRKSNKPDERMLAAFQDDLQNILYVGRLAPNKNLEALIIMFAYLHCIHPATRLIIAGSKRTCPKYYALLNLLAARLNLANVIFTDYVNESELSALYTAASAFVTASTHEGYCLPLIEAMSYQVPVIAPDRGGMPETMGDAGIRYDHLNAEQLALLVSHALHDQKIRGDVLVHQMHRIQQIEDDQHGRKWLQLIDAV